MDWPGPGRAQVVVPPSSLWQPAEFTWRIQPVSRSLAVGGRRTGRVCGPTPPSPPGISIVLSHATPIRTPCTRGVQGMLKGCSRLRRLYTPRASGVLPLYTARIAKDETVPKVPVWDHARPREPWLFRESAETRREGPDSGVFLPLLLTQEGRERPDHLTRFAPLNPRTKTDPSPLGKGRGGLVGGSLANQGSGAGG